MFLDTHLIAGLVSESVKKICADPEFQGRVDSLAREAVERAMPELVERRAKELAQSALTAYFSRDFGDTPEGPGVAVIREKVGELRPVMDSMTSSIADRLVRDEAVYAGVVKHYLSATIGEAAALAVDRKMTAVRRREKAGKKGAAK